MKRLIALLLIAMLLVGCLPAVAMAKAKQMNDGVPVWTQDTVSDYILAYSTGKMMNTLYGYYDLQIRRYMPMSTYESMLTELEWMTGKLQGLGSYRCFEETVDKAPLKTHVLHLCMEKIDLDMYFTHKNKEDDWEVMAVEFALAPEEPLADGSDMLVDATAGTESEYDEVLVTFGSADSSVEGTLTIPKEASADNPVPGCVLINDWGALDRNGTRGATTMYADLARALAQMGIASIRCDSYSYTHSVDADTSVDDEYIDIALDAGKLLLKDDFIDHKRVVLIGHGFGATLAPRVANESDGMFTGMVMIAPSISSPLKQIVNEQAGEVASLSADQLAQLSATADGLYDMRKSKASDMVILGRNGLYFWEMKNYDPVTLIKKLKLRTYIVQGDGDPYVSEDDGWRAYANAIGDGATYMSFKSFSGLNHLLMAQTALTADGQPDYSVAATLSEQAGRNISQWILSMLLEEE